MALSKELLAWFEEMGLALDGRSMMIEKAKEEHVETFLNTFKEKRDESFKILYIECVPTHFLTVSVGRRALESRITLKGFVESIPRLRTIIEGVVASVGMAKDENFDDFIESTSNINLIEEPLLENVLFKGQAPDHAEPPTVKLLVKSFGEKPTFSEDDEGNVDYHDLNLFQNVIQNQHIGDYVPAKPGVGGRDVFGNAIPAQEAKQVPVQCGQGVLFDENAGKYYAGDAGYVVYEDHKLHIEKVYEIGGDVDLNVGHVNFVSDVVVHGDILPDFSVRAGGKLEVHGTVTGAQITSDTDINLTKGVLGQGKSVIKCNGNINAKFVNDTQAEIGGDMHLGVESLNSSLFCLSKIMAERAVVIGGRVVGLGEIHCGTLGSDLGLKTEVFLGEDYRRLNKTESLRESIFKLKEKAELQFSRYGDDITYWQKPHETANKDEIEKLQAKLNEFQSILNDLKLLNQEFELMNSERPQGRAPVCRVEKGVYPGVVFFCCGAYLEIKEKLKGPITFKEDKSANGKIFISVDRS